MDQIEIRFLPQNIFVQTAKDSSVLEAARRAGIEVESSCNGKGTCGKCLVRHVEGILEEPHPDESRLLAKESLADGIRLACRVKAKRNSVFSVIAGNTEKSRILSNGFMPQFDLNPEIRKVSLKMQAASLEDPADDLSRIVQAVGLRSVDMPLPVLRELPAILRENGYKATLVLHGGRLLGVEPGDTTRANYGVAVDIGTTTVVASLWDLSTGTELAVCSCVNPQKAFGLDVLSRIQHVRESAEGLHDLQAAIIKAINLLIEEACAEAAIEKERVYEAAIAANSTMMHLVLGVDPSGIGRSPYIPVFTKEQSFQAKDLGIEISRFGQVYCLPSVSAYVGADIVAGILCTELSSKKERALFIDIGTNGEIVFSSGDQLSACSCAAGPALEGMNISCGMRAAEGAIEKVSIDEGITISTIGRKEAVGICGSGIIDAVGELLKAGIINQSGRFVGEQNGWALRLWNDDDGKKYFVLSFGLDGTPRVRLTQNDIRQVQLAKGAILSGLLALMGHLQLEFTDIDHVYIAGAFGCHLRMENLARLGVLPPQLLDRVVLVGNTSKSGAALVLLSQEKRAEASRIARKIQYVELSCYPGFDRLFAQSLSFPGICL